MENQNNSKDTSSTSNSSKQTSSYPTKSDLDNDLSSTNHLTHNGQLSTNSFPLTYSEKKLYRPYDPTTPLDGEDSFSTLVRVIKYILSTDTMDQEFVSSLVQSGNERAALLSNVMTHRLIQKLNASEQEILEAIKTANFKYDENTNLINIGVKAERKVVVLQAPVDITIDEIKAFFGDMRKEITDFKEDVEHTWFISFTNEDHAIDAVLTCSRKKLGEHKVSVRMKSDNVVKRRDPKTENIYQPIQNPVNLNYQWYPDGYTPYNLPEYMSGYDSKQFRKGRFRGRGRKSHQGSRGSKDSGNVPFQLMGNGEFHYGKKSSHGFLKSTNSARGKSSSKKSSPPSLGTTNFPPLGSSAVALCYSREEILAARDSPLEVEIIDTDDNPVLNLSGELLSYSESTEGVLKDDIVESKWVDQRRSRSNQRRRRPSHLAKMKVTDSPSRSPSVSREREIKNVENQLQDMVLGTEESNLKPNWAEIAKASGN